MCGSAFISSPTYPCSPCGKKFRSKPQIARFLGDNADLTPFDFSRAGTPGDGTQRRRARDRANTTKRLEPAPRSMMPLIRPLSSNPLRATGPIRRTCGVIKLPVTWVSPPSDEELRSNLVVGHPKATPSPISLVVQALWEKRLFGVKPCDHATGSEIPPNKTTNGLVETSEVIKTTPLTPISKSQSPKNPSPPQPLLSPTLHSPPPILPTSLLKTHAIPRPSPLPSAAPVAAVPVSTGSSQPSHLQQNLILLPLQQQQQQGLPGTKMAANGPTPHTAPPTVSLTITDTEVKQQEERVRLLRQQLLAAQSSA